jgi:hypothetical protein
MSKIILTYTSPTQRMKYSAHILFNVCLGMEAEWDCTSKTDALTISFCGSSISCPSHAISLEDDENALSSGVNWSEWGRFKYPCEVLGITDLQFDPLASVFFCCVRWEELQSQGDTNTKFRDEHGRFRGAASTAYMNKMLTTPLVENLAHALAAELKIPKELYATDYTFEPTIDIDIAYAFKGRGVFHNAFAAIRDVVFFRWGSLRNRIDVFIGGVDPYFTYDWLIKLHDQVKLQTRFFILYAEYKRPHDLPVHKEVLDILISHLVKSSFVSWHPSYAASSSSLKFDNEKKTFENNGIEGGNKTEIVRTHFLLGEQSSWKQFVDAGIKHDYSMGYADQVGFRSGMSKPYPAYDLVNEQPLDLIIHPFAVMDSTLKSYLHLDTSEALNTVSQLSDSVREVGGVMVTIWHNTSVSDHGIWEGWQSLYKEVVLRCIP